MSLRKLEPEEKTTISTQFENLNRLFHQAKESDVEAYNYDWLKLSAKLQSAIELFEGILNKKEARVF